MRHLFALLLPLSLAGLASGENRVIAVSVDNVIHPITIEILAHGIEQAEREKELESLYSDATGESDSAQER